MKNKYRFTGIVYLFDTIVSNNYIAETYAVTEKKAMNNITFRCKNEMGYLQQAKIKLEGQLQLI